MNAKYQGTGLERQQRDLEVHGYDWHVDVLQLLVEFFHAPHVYRLKQ